MLAHSVVNNSLSTLPITHTAGECTMCLYRALLLWTDDQCTGVRNDLAQALENKCFSLVKCHVVQCAVWRMVSGISVLARIEKFSNLPVINFFFTVIKTKDQLFLRGIWADKMRKKAHKLAVYVFRY